MKLKLTKQTISDLTVDEQKKIEGQGPTRDVCETDLWHCEGSLGACPTHVCGVTENGGAFCI